MDDARDLEDLVLEDPHRVRNGEHERRHVLGHGLLENVQVERAARVGLQLLDLVAGEVRRGRIRAVGRVRDQDRRARVAGLRERRADHEDARQFALRARGGLESHPRKAGQFDQSLLELPHQLERALRHGLGRERVPRREARQPRHLLVDARVVLHGAGAERVHVLIDREVQARESREVTRDLDLGDLGPSRDLLAQERWRDRDDRGHVERRQRVADLAPARALENERLLARLGAPGVCGGRDSGLVFDLNRHQLLRGGSGDRKVSRSCPSAATRRSISSFRFISVAATRNALGRDASQRESGTPPRI